MVLVRITAGLWIRINPGGTVYGSVGGLRAEVGIVGGTVDFVLGLVEDIWPVEFNCIAGQTYRDAVEGVGEMLEGVEYGRMSWIIACIAAK